MKILVAEDDAISRRLLGATLGTMGHKVVPVSNGTEALAALQDPDGPRLALIDWNMPELDGVDVCRQLRHGNRYIYIILITGRADRKDIIAGLDSGADDYVVKPFEADVLRARIRAGQRVLSLHLETERVRSSLEAVLASVDNGVLLGEPGGTIIYANNAVAHLFDIPTMELVGATRDHVLARSGAEPGDFRYFGRMLRWTTKPVSLPEGMGTLDLFRDVTVEVERERVQIELARRDPLTGLWNRRGAEDAVARELSRQRRSGSPLSVAVFDLDHFKRVNDHYGHAVGDRVLQAVAVTLTNVCRVTDVVVRWGGEEMVAILPATPLEGARALAERVRIAVEEWHEDAMPSVTLSAGVAELAPGHDFDWLIAVADERLYAAKADGRNRVA